MGVNTGLLQQVADEINENVFQWNQSDWVDSGYVPDGLSPEAFENACNTSYCFAGRVATLERDQLYVRSEISGRFMAGTYLVALDSDQFGRMSNGPYVTHYRAVKRNGKIVFEEYDGPTIHAQNAAINDLEINNDAADALFSGSNSLNDINNLVERIIELGDNFTHYDEEDYEEDEYEGCDCDLCVDDE